MKRLLHLFSRKTRSIAENEAFVTLIRVAREDADVKDKLLAILRLDDFNRKSALHTSLEQMRLKQAPAEFVSAIASLLDNEIAEKVLKMLTDGEPDADG